MGYINRYFEFRAELIKELKEQLVTKEYDKTSVWEDESEKWRLPIQYYMGDFMYDIYIIVKYAMDGFKGVDPDSEDELWFEIEYLDTKVIAHILDILNEDTKNTLDT